MRLTGFFEPNLRVAGWYLSGRGVGILWFSFIGGYIVFGCLGGGCSRVVNGTQARGRITFGSFFD